MALKSGDLCLRRRRTIEGKEKVKDILVAERKAINDLYGSIQSGRLFIQMERLERTCLVPVLAISGDIFTLKKKLRAMNKLNVDTALVYNTVADIMTQTRIRVLWLSTDEEIYDVIYQMAIRVSLNKSDKPILRQKNKLIDPESALRTIPGITSLKAAQLLHKHGTLGEIARLILDDPKSITIKGLGPSTKSQMRKFFWGD